MLGNRRHPWRTILTSLPILVVFVLLDEDFSGMDHLGPLTLKWLPGVLVVGGICTMAFDLLCHKPVEQA